MTTETAAPKLATLKYQVQQILHADADTTIMKIGDQKAFGTAYVLKVVKRAGEDEEEEEPEAKKPKKKDAPPPPGPEALEASLARAAACHEASEKLSHPSLLKYFDYKTKKNWLFQVTRGELLMEYVNGASLDKVASFQLPDLVLIAQEVVAGLAHMQRRGVLHGDLRPAHILLSRSGQVKVIGYGMSLLKKREHLVGSRLYLAPESIKSKELSEKTDIYAFGAVMYHLMTGQPANVGKREFGDSGKIPTPQALNPKITTALNNVLVACLQGPPEKRPESMFDVQEQLKAAAKGMSLQDRSLRGITAPSE